MARITWDQPGEKKFQAGVDRGVLYTPLDLVEIGPIDKYPRGIAWNGLKSVDLKQEGVSATPVHFDGVKTFDVIYGGDTSGSLKAFTYPDEFVPFDGFGEPTPGFFIDNQLRPTFGLSYRTLLGDDQSGIDLGYELHLLYNITAISDGVSNQTVDSNINPIEFSWSLTSVPDDLYGFRPSAHMKLDSTKLDPTELEIIENVLYGEGESDARMISMSEILSILTLDVEDNGDGTWTASGPEQVLRVASNGTFQLVAGAAVYTDEGVISIPV